MMQDSTAGSPLPAHTSYDETTVETDPVRIFWLDEMVAGYLDGRKRDSVLPSGNRSHSYRHGWANGRDDRLGRPRATAAQLRVLCEAAIALDIAACSPRRSASDPNGTAE